MVGIERAKVAEDDEDAIDQLILSEAKINSTYSKYGFHLSTTVVETSGSVSFSIWEKFRWASVIFLILGFLCISGCKPSGKLGMSQKQLIKNTKWWNYHVIKHGTSHDGRWIDDKGNEYILIY